MLKTCDAKYDCEDWRRVAQLGQLKIAMVGIKRVISACAWVTNLPEAQMLFSDVTNDSPCRSLKGVFSSTATASFTEMSHGQVCMLWLSGIAVGWLCFRNAIFTSSLQPCACWKATPRSLKRQWSLCEYVIVHTILGGTPVTVCGSHWVASQNGFHWNLIPWRNAHKPHYIAQTSAQKT